MVDEEKIIEYMKKIAKIKGVICSETFTNIAKAKANLLKENWVHCPCDADNPGRFCISTQCQADIDHDGTCHCGAYKKI